MSGSMAMESRSSCRAQGHRLNAAVVSGQSLVQPVQDERARWKSREQSSLGLLKGQCGSPSSGASTVLAATEGGPECCRKLKHQNVQASSRDKCLHLGARHDRQRAELV